MVKAEIQQLVDRMNSLVKAVEGFAQEGVTARTQLNTLQNDHRAHEIRITQLENFITPIMEDNLLVYHGNQIREIQVALGATTDSDANALLSIPDRMHNLETAVRQLGNSSKET